MTYSDRDTDFLPERDEARERRIRREVRYLSDGEAPFGSDGRFSEEGAEERDAEERAAEEAERAAREREAFEAEAERRARTIRRRKRPVFRILSGTILVGEQATRYYPYLATLAVLFFLNIAVLFWSLHLDRRYLRLEREVQVLRERAIRFGAQRSRTTAHSAIVEEIERRGLGLADPAGPNEIIDE